MMHSVKMLTAFRALTSYARRVCDVVAGRGWQRWGVLAYGLAACSSPEASNPVQPVPAETYRALTLRSHAITMSTEAPYDTLQLVATARSGLGTPLAGAPAPTFITTDSSVRVSPTGLLTARAVRSNVLVIAALTYQGVRLADTAMITVTDVAAPQIVDHLVIQPQSGTDATLPIPTFVSLIYGANGNKRLDVEVQDASGATISEALIALTTSTPLSATFPGSPLGAQSVTTVTTSGPVVVAFDPAKSRPGLVTVSADATIYGVTVRDSLVVTLRDPVLAVLEIGKETVTGNTPGSTWTHYTVLPSRPVTIGVGGFVWWVNFTPDSLDVVFDDPATATADVNVLNSGGGNIPPFVGCPGVLDHCLNAASRQFLQSGTVQFHSVKTGISGTIIVQ